MRYKLELSYKGTAYCGWQRQPNAMTVQEKIENALSLLLRQDISITGCGRTDTGVHASHYVAHFDFEGSLKPDFVYHLNCVLPEDICIKKNEHTSDDFHARFNAKNREYTYKLLVEKNPFLRELTWQYRMDLDINKMNIAASYLLIFNDFETFSKVGSDNKTTLCKVTKAHWKRQDNTLTFTICADRFLRNMVRSIVGTLVDVGRGKISPQDFKKILESKDRSKASSSAAAQGLYLSKIEY
ncbi:MAG: tRNA pseudouridine(38-40) synthase TruA [Rikenellaceae bacterium]